MCSPLNAFREATKLFVTLDMQEMASRSGAEYRSGQEAIAISYFGSTYLVDRSGKVWREDEPGGDVPYNDRTIILQYLCHCSGLPPRGIWLSFLELPDGAHHYVPLQNDATIPMAQAFDGNIDLFAGATAALGGQPMKMGDSSFYIPALPKLPLAVVLWEGDDEFPPRSNILFDSVAQLHLSTAALWVLGVELAVKMMRHSELKNGEAREITWLGGVGDNS